MYGHSHRTGPRQPRRPRPTADAALVADILASLAQHPERQVEAYTQRPAVAAAVRAALAAATRRKGATP